MRVLVSDASILIELAKWSLLEAAFELPFEFAIPDALYEDELIDLGATGRRQLKVLGLRIESLGADGVAQAISYLTAIPQLTIYDCFAVTLAVTNGWVLLTGDKRMRKLAEKEKIEVHGTLWVIDRFIEHQVVRESTLEKALRGMMKDPRTHLPHAEIKKLLARLSAAR